MINVNYTAFKTFVTAGSLQIIYVDDGSNYTIYGMANAFTVSCALPKDGGEDQLDFETNLKPTANRPLIMSTAVTASPAYGSKTTLFNGEVKKLFTRFTGAQYAMAVGSNTVNYTVNYVWAKLIGVEAVNCEALDTVDFKVFDNAQGTYSGVPNALLNQFSFTLNLSKDYYLRMAQFDADIYQGMVIQITYNSISAKTIGVNFLFNEVK